MKRYKVVCIGYKEPSIKKIQEFVEFEDSWLTMEKLGRRILVHPQIRIDDTENYNQKVLDELKAKHYNEYNIHPSDFDTTYDFNARFKYNITIE